jgi:hypothetical protein
MCGAAFVALVAGLTVGVEALPGGRASAGPGGTPYGVYVSDFSSLQELTLGSLSTAGSPVTKLAVTDIGINSTDTVGVATTYTDYRGGAAATIFAVPANTVTGTISGLEPVGYAMSPVDPNTAYCVTAGGQVDAINLAAATSTTIANLNPTGASFNATSIAATPDGRSVVVGGILNSFGFVSSVTTFGGSVTTYQGALRDSQIDDLAVAPDGSAVYAAANFGTSALVFSLPFPFNGKSALRWADSSSNGRLAMAFPTSLTVTRGNGTVYVAGLNANGGSVVQSFSTSNGNPLGSVALPYNSSSNGSSGGFNGGVTSIALSPDGRTLLAIGGSYNSNATFVSVSSFVVQIATAGLVVGSRSGTLSGSTPIGPRDIVVTPDQAPVAGLTAVSGTAGSPVNFDASSSTVAFGTITNYSWDFGDGSAPVDTSAPTVSHVYGSQGTYTATVTETDIAGTSVPPAPSVPGAVNGPGTSPYLDASPSASLSEQVPVSKKGTPPPPPPPPPKPSTTTTTTTTATSTTIKSSGSTTTTTLPGTPTITLTPTVGPPGTIVNVSGHGFPPNRNVTVSWSTNNGSYTEMSDAHGNLPAHVFYVLVPDILGTRQAIATTPGVPAAQAKFLVVIRTSEPGGGLGAAFFRAESE